MEKCAKNEYVVVANKTKHYLGRMALAGMTAFSAVTAEGVLTQDVAVASDHYPAGSTDAEVRWCGPPSRWRLCARATWLSKEASWLALDVVRGNKWDTASLGNGRGDAFRHCYWSSRMTQEFGSETAKGFGDRHEEDPKESAQVKAMDLHNNAKGREWAWLTPGLLRDSAGIKQRCIVGIYNGELKNDPRS